MIKLLWLNGVAAKNPKIRVRFGVFLDGMISDISVPATAITTNSNVVIVGGQTYAWADVFFIMCGNGSHLIDWAKVPPSYFDDFTLAAMREEHKRLHGGSVTIDDVVMWTPQTERVGAVMKDFGLNTCATPGCVLHVAHDRSACRSGSIAPEPKRTLRNGWVVYDGGKHVPPVRI